MKRRSLLSLAPAGLLGGCSLDPDVDHTGDDVPSAAPLSLKPGVAWVFSSGGPRGVVHVGVLKALDELGLAPTLVAGASAGAIVGTLCAAGIRAPELVAATLDLDAWRIARYAWGSAERLSTLGLADWLHDRLGGRKLEELPVPMACVVQDMAARRAVAFTRGDASLAAAASAAIEGQLTPLRLRGRLYADADLVVPLPVRMARSLGATRVLAVDASAHEDKAPVGTERWRPADARKRALTQPDAREADVLLHPDSGYYASFSREHRQRMIDVGYRSAMEQADKLLALHRMP